MRGQAEGVAGGDPPAWWVRDGVEVGEGIASLGAVERLVRAIRAERAGRVAAEQRDADGARRLVRAVLHAAATTVGDRWLVPADTGRGSGR